MATRKSTEVAVVTTSEIAIPKSSKDVPAAIEALKKQLTALKGDIEDKISLDVDYNGENIKDVSTVKELLQISASLHAREAAYNVELKRYGLEDKKIQPFNESSLPVSKWEKIIEKAIFELMNKKQIEKIESAIKTLSTHLDAETKLKNELESIMKNAQEFVQ